MLHVLKQLRSFNGSVAVLDFETTGLSPENDYPTEVAYRKFHSDGSSEVYSSLIELPAGVEIPKFVTELTGLTTNQVNECGVVKEVMKVVLEDMAKDTLVVAHNANFDLGFLYHHYGVIPKNFLCTRTIEYLTNNDQNVSSSLEPTYKRYFGEVIQEHRSLSDVDMTLKLLEKHIEIYGTGIENFLNKVIVTPGRNLVYTPDNAIVLDFTLAKHN